jgi:hypothetical protein
MLIDYMSGLLSPPFGDHGEGSQINAVGAFANREYGEPGRSLNEPPRDRRRPQLPTGRALL